MPPLHPIPHPDAVGAKHIAGEPAQQFVGLSNFGGESPQNLLPTARARPALGLGDPSRVHMLTQTAAMLEDRTLTDLDRAKTDAVDARAVAAENPPDAPLVPKLDAALLEEQPTALYPSSGFLRRTR